MAKYDTVKNRIGSNNLVLDGVELMILMTYSEDKSSMAQPYRRSGDSLSFPLGSAAISY